LMRRMSPWTRISGGRPAERWRSEALFLTAKARSSVMSIYNSRSSGAAAAPWQYNRQVQRNSRARVKSRVRDDFRGAARRLSSKTGKSSLTLLFGPADYEPLREDVASCERADRRCDGGNGSRSKQREVAGGLQDFSSGSDSVGPRAGTAGFRRKLRTGSNRKATRAR